MELQNSTVHHLLTNEGVTGQVVQMTNRQSTVEA